MGSPRRCQSCKSTDESTLRINSISKSGRISYMCRICNNKRGRKYYAQNKEKFREIIYRSIRKHREKQDAREKLNYALKSGRMKKPDVCEMCNCRNKIHGHHEDYSKPLEVMWLCTACHGLVHRMKKQTVDSKVS